MHAFSVVAIHDDFSAGIRAQEALKWLEHSLGSDLEIRSLCWSFHKLERVDLRAMTIREAAAADVIIVAADDTQHLPEHISRWLDASLQNSKGGHVVLVALHDEGEDAACDPEGALCSQLRHVAGLRCTQFMCNKDFDERLDRHHALRVIDQKREASLHSHRPLELYFHSAAGPGGINE